MYFYYNNEIVWFKSLYDHLLIHKIIIFIHILVLHIEYYYNI